jgi:hypothetical protein
MKNSGLFSTIFLESVQQGISCPDDAQGRLVTLSQSWQRRDATDASTLWKSFVKAALGNLGFIIQELSGAQYGRGIHTLYEDYGFQNSIALLYLVEPDTDLDDQSVGRFWPAKLVNALRERKLNWGILSNGATWRLYSTKSAKPFEDHVELDLAAALSAQDQVAYALFERFFHADCFVPVEREDYEQEKAKQFKALGLKVKRQKRAESQEEEEGGEVETDAEKERKAGIYLSRLDLDGEISEAVLEARVKSPLLGQVDGVLRYICNGFIADTPRTGDAYTEDERREVFESSVKLLYRCLFLFYAEARKLLPSEDRHAELYAPHSIRALCLEARKFRWNERKDNHGHDLWQHLKGLVQAVNEGDSTYGIMGYNGGLFDDQEEKFLGKHRLRNDFLWPALYWLAFVDPAQEGAEKEYAIPYQDLEVRHLGEMYEAILEYKVRLADTDYLRRRTKNGWQTLPAAGQRTQEGDVRIEKGAIFFGETALERKQSGSYYTPESLVRFLVEKAVIQPLRERWDATCENRFCEYLDQTRTGFDEAARRGALRAAEELVHDFVKREVLSYKVCDPAMGSGHFLVAAANLMAGFVAGLLARIEPLPGTPSSITGAPNHWRRLITRHCLYGADLNPLAVNLAKLALWLNCFARDHKLTFLDHHLRCGNSLIGLRDLAALKTIPIRRKDSKRITEEIMDAENELPLGLDKELDSKLAAAAQAITAIHELAEDETDRQRNAFEEASEELHAAFAPLADLHTAYLMDSSIRPGDYARLLAHFAEEKPESLVPLDLRDVWDRVKSLQQRHDFFHWPLEFPDVFGKTGSAGFSATVGNPPWDVVKPSTLEFYSQLDPNFRTYTKQEALRVAQKLCENPVHQQQWDEYEQSFKDQSAYFGEPEAVPALGKGDINTYKLFLNRFFVVLREGGHMAILVPSGLYTDEGCFPLRQMFFQQSQIDSLYCFENRWPEVFSAVHNSFKFITFATCKGGSTESFRCAFMQHDPTRLELIEESAPRVTLDQVSRFSPTALGLMEFNNQADVDVIDRIYGQWPLLGNEVKGTWNATFDAGFHMTNDSDIFEVISGCIAESHQRLWEGKHIWLFDSEFDQPTNQIRRKAGRDRLGKNAWASECYRVGFRDVAASTNERTLISTIVSPGFCNNKLPTIQTQHVKAPSRYPTPAEAAYLTAVFASIVCDFVIRKKVTNNMNFFYMKTLPIPRLSSGDARDTTYFWPIVARTLRLVCTISEYADLWAEVFPQIPSDTIDALMTPPPAYGPAHEQGLRARLAESYGDLTATWSPACGLHNRKPDRRDDGDRAQTRAELDALVAHLYGLTRDEFAYILDTFPVLRRKELTAFGEYQSKRKALEEFERFEVVNQKCFQ